MNMSLILDNIFTVVLIIMAILLLLCLIRAIIGPRVADRIVCVNMMGTIVMGIIAILAVKMAEGYLADICLIYAMISFLAVVVLCKVYLGVYREKKTKEALENQKAKESDAVKNETEENR